MKSVRWYVVYGDRYEYDSCAYHPNLEQLHAHVWGFGQPDPDWIRVQATAITWDGQRSQPSYLDGDWDLCRDEPWACN